MVKPKQFIIPSQRMASHLPGNGYNDGLLEKKHDALGSAFRSSGIRPLEENVFGRDHEISNIRTQEIITRFPAIAFFNIVQSLRANGESLFRTLVGVMLLW